MTRDEVIRILSENRAELRKMGVRSLALFGSAARGELRPDSDIDLLVDLEPPYTYDRYIHIKFFIEDMLQRSVDLVMSETLKARVRPYIEKEAIYVP
jgi:uncharacterized protein